ncbi:acyl-[acyl-carrier-protein] thioesterase [Mycobacterium sp. CPCC 205372]|uniref:Acyl-[acyl-carrier-protein] thioesterase n=1 Tax=Mycobacterium hippophais TaxID=3016340 RepID=A0ABT4PMM2_9MYCO|nr:acyl-[acyl-carrier-protein] thioesterase [Mycobacterium hippophais]MCZ8377806.1 acyl-[acyl-carrier-protein] thioesterase [Mycobacterium hippophais]
MSTAQPDAARPLHALPDTGYVFRTGWRLTTSDIDEHRRIRLDGVARYIQEAGAEHLVDSGFADVNPHWIVQRTVIDVVEPIEWPSDITLRRWCSGISNRWCSMRVRLDGSEGGLVETEGFWINMNKDTQTPSLIDGDLFTRFASTTDETRLKWRPWLPGPAEPEASIPFALRHTDIDHFRHVNNTVYWHGVHEVMARYPDIATAPYRAVVEYRKPIQRTDDVVIHFASRDGGLRVWFVVGDTVHAAALVRSL